MKNSNKHVCVGMSMVRYRVCVCVWIISHSSHVEVREQFCGLECLFPTLCEFWRIEPRMPKLLCQCLYLLSHLVGPFLVFWEVPHIHFHGSCDSIFINIYFPTSLECYIFRESFLTIWSVQPSFPLPLEVWISNQYSLQWTTLSPHPYFT